MRGQVCVPLKMLSSMNVHLAKRALSLKPERDETSKYGNMNQISLPRKRTENGATLFLIESTYQWRYSLYLGVKISLALQQARVLKSTYS